MATSSWGEDNGGDDLGARRVKRKTPTEGDDRLMASKRHQTRTDCNDAPPKFEPTIPVAVGIAESQVQWLNQLSDEEALALYTLSRGTCPSVPRCRLSESTMRVLLPLRAMAPLERDGSWYVRFSTCRVVASNDASNSHHRWQFKVSKTPSKTSMGGRVRAALGQQAWESLVSVASTSGAKLACHHVAYRASPRWGNAPIPLNVGRGGSISHLCDERNCIEQDHLLASPVHKDKMDRQRCHGVLLTVFRGVIVKETPCEHGLGQGVTLQEKLHLSCRFVSLSVLTDLDFEALVGIAEQMM